MSSKENNSNEPEDADMHRTADVPSRQSASFYSLLKDNREFRFYIASYLVTKCGEWLTYVASISMIEEWLFSSSGDDVASSSSSSSRTAISYLVVIHLMPNVLFSAVGGALADSRDRRKSMIALDLLGSLVTLLNLVALYYQSIAMVYIVTWLQESVAALYEPCRGALLPLLVTDDEELKKATTLSGLSWSLMTAVGASLGGVIVAFFGWRVCFFVDSITYLISAYLMYQVQGDWSAIDKGSRAYKSIWDQMVTMTVDGYRYVAGKFWGPLVFLKASIALIYGASDILNVAFSERGTGDADLKLGILFAMSGIGSMIGPLVSDRFTSMSNMKSLQLASVLSICSITLGYLGMGLLSPFVYTCLFSVVRSAGSSACWINSSVLLQSFSAPEKMGRVLAVDYAFALLTEAFSALLSGVLQDNAGMSAEQVSLVMACIGTIIFGIWSLYHFMGHGAACKDLDELLLKDKAQDSEMRKAATEQAPLIFPVTTVV